jgi:hypothetical protein
MNDDMLREMLAEFPDGRILVRYADGEYWLIGKDPKSGRQVSMKVAAIRVVKDNAVLDPNAGTAAFHRCVAKERELANDRSI